jgi:Fe-S oxidoreductase
MSTGGTPIKPYPARDVSLLGLAPVAVEDRPRRAVELLGEMREQVRSLRLFMDSCTKCGACAEQCHSYLGTRDPHNIPAARVDLVRKIYKRYFTTAGRIAPGLVGAEDATQETLEEWYKYFYQCNECRRCAVFCPMKIDTAEVTIAARQILTKLGITPKFIMGIASNMHRTGNNMGIPVLALKDSVEFLEQEMLEETGKSIPIPVDQEGAEVLYNPSSSDFFANPDSMIGAAKMFYAAGTTWTISSEIVETANFGLFFDKGVMKEHSNRLLNAARKLKAKRIVAGECGHGWRTWKMFTPELNDRVEFPIQHGVEEAMQYIKQGRIRVDRTANPQKVTLHDPCNMARAAGIIEEPRYVLNSVAENFVEMYPNREKSFCCGGGSGILMDEIKDVRIKLGKAKADSVRATGAEILVAPCAICKAQLPVAMEGNGVEVTVKGLLDLLGRAIIL